jgi:UDP-N-acetylmuramate dehydrogenase
VIAPEREVSLAPMTSLRVGGVADWFVLAESAALLVEALAWANERELPVRLIGGGSNLLIADDGVEGLVIKTAFSRAHVEGRDGEQVLVAEAGANLANYARRVAKQDLGGLEWAANVPGTVGGAAVNNAGAFGGETAACLISVTVVGPGGTRTRLEPDELGYGYRTSALKRRELGNVAVELVELRLNRCPHGEADARIKEFNAQRMRSQPRIQSAGSVFANPQGSFAGMLIEQAGLKGRTSGGAQISEQHANFIVNAGGATAHDVHSLMCLAQRAVLDRTGTWMRAEIELLGRWTEQERMALAGPMVVSGG